MRQRNGQVWEYGRDPATTESVGAATRDGQTVRFSWHLARISDASLNTIDFFYEAEPDSVERRLIRIAYTGSTSPSASPSYQTPQREVRLQYESRPDPVEGYVSGVRTTAAKRLSRIEVHGPNPTNKALVWAYVLAYHQSPFTNRSSLDAVSWCDAAGVCLPPTRFRWNHVEAGPETFEGYEDEYWGVTLGRMGFDRQDIHPGEWTRLLAGDLNGDGRDDLIYTQLDPRDAPVACDRTNLHTRVFVRLSRMSPSGTVSLGTAIEVSSVFADRVQFGFERRVFDPFRSHLADFDNDGRAELLAAGVFTDGVGFKVLRWDDEQQTLVPIGGVIDDTAGASVEPRPAVLADTEGEQTIDLFMPGTSFDGRVTWFHVPNLFQLPSCTVGGPGGCYTTPGFDSRYDTGVRVDLASGRQYVADIDGDGRPEMIEESLGTYKSIGSTNVSAQLDDLNGTRFWTFIDINGDGLKDVVGRDASSRFQARVNTGRGFLPVYNPYEGPSINRSEPGTYFDDIDIKDSIRVADFNGDGYEDLLLLDDGRGRSPNCKGYELIDEPATILYSDGRMFHRARLSEIQARASERLRHDGMATRSPRGWSGTTVADINGDGTPEIIQLVRDGVPYQDNDPIAIQALAVESASVNFIETIKNTMRRDVIVRIDDGYVTEQNSGSLWSERIDYLDISSPLAARTEGVGAADVYRRSTACRYPQYCATRGVSVVWQHGASRTAATVPNLRPFHYEDGRVDVKGRGFLGFSKVTTRDSLRGSRTISQYDLTTTESLGGTTYAYPFAGMPLETESTIAPSLRRVSSPVTGDARRRVRVIRTPEVRQASGGYTVETRLVDVKEYESTATGAAPVRHQTTSYDYDAFGNIELEMRSTTDGDTVVTSARYDNLTQDSWILGLPRRQEITSTVADAGGTPRSRTRVTEYDYYPDTPLVSEVRIEPESTEPDIRSTTGFVRGPDGLITTVQVQPLIGDTRNTTVGYDEDGSFPRRLENALGHVSWLGYHPGIGALVVNVDPNGVTSRWQLDGFGRLRKTIPADGSSESIELLPPPDGITAMTLRTSGADGSMNEVVYDFAERPVLNRVQGFDGRTIQSEVAYDDLHRVTEVIRPHFEAGPFERTTFEYDNLDRPVTVTAADSSVVQRTYPSFFETHVFDEESHETVELRDVNGRVVQTSEVLGTQRIPVDLFYAPFGDLEVIRRHRGTESIETRLDYDVLGRRTAVEDPNAGRETTRYNAFGDVRGMTNPETNVSYVLDRLGRIDFQIDNDGPTDFTWDTSPGGLGALDTAISPDGVVVDVDYDSLGRPFRETISHFPSGIFQTEMTFDGLGRLSTVKYPVARLGTPRFEVRYGYNANGYLETVSDNRPGAAVDYWKQEVLEPALEQERAGNGAVTRRSFDVQTGKLLDLDVARGGAIVQDTHYEYFANGNLQLRSDSVAGRTEEFLYDTLNRLTRWTAGSRQLRYSYDDVGNFTNVETRVNGAVTAAQPYTYLGLGNAGPEEPSSSGPFGYSYDRAGRQTTQSLGPVPVREVSYTTFDLPREVSAFGTATKRFAYDAFQRRFRKADPSAETIYVGDLYERRKASVLSPEEHVHYIQAGRRTVAQLVQRTELFSLTETVSYFHDDLIDSVDAVSSSTTQSRRYYEPFGARVDLQGNSVKSAGGITRGFGGHEHDDELALVNMGGRLYDPGVRRFMTPDPVLASGTSPQSLNRFSYALNNPLRYRDPTGFMNCDVGFCDVFQLPDLGSTVASDTTEAPDRTRVTYTYPPPGDTQKAGDRSSAKHSGSSPVPVPGFDFSIGGSTLEVSAAPGFGSTGLVEWLGPSSLGPPVEWLRGPDTRLAQEQGRASFHHLLEQPEFRIVDTSKTWERGMDVATAMVPGPGGGGGKVAQWLAKRLARLGVGGRIVGWVKGLVGPRAARGASLAARFGTTSERVAVLQRVITSEGGLNTSRTVAQQLARGGARSHIPNQSIMDTIGSGVRAADPQGVGGQFMYRAEAAFNGSRGTLEVLVHEASGEIRHVLFRSGVVP